MEKKLTEGFRAWLRESLRLLFLLYFQPTKFQEEVDDIGDERYPKVWDRVKAMLGYHLRLLPWTVLLAILFRWGGSNGMAHPSPAAPVQTLLGWGNILSSVAVGVAVVGAAASQAGP